MLIVPILATSPVEMTSFMTAVATNHFMMQFIAS